MDEQQVKDMVMRRLQQLHAEVKASPLRDDALDEFIVAALTAPYSAEERAGIYQP